MWNRVVLLCAGVATGWTAVNLLTCPRALIRGQRVRLAIAVALATTTAAWLAHSMPASALLGLGVYLLAAVPAYVANAQRASSPEPDPGPPPPLSSANLSQTSELVAPENHADHILLVSPGPPPHYEGPAGWAYRLSSSDHTPAKLIRRVLFPFSLARIRQAYDAMPQGHPNAQYCTRLARALSDRAPNSVVRCVYLQGSPHLRQLLRGLRHSPPARLRMILLDVPGSRSEHRTREILTGSRLRETAPGLSLAFCPPQDADHDSTLIPQPLDRATPIPNHGSLSAHIDALLATLETI